MAKAKFIRFDTVTAPKQAMNVACINISSDGGFYLSAALIQRMGCKEGDCYAVLRDAADPKAWYLLRDPKGYPVRVQRQRRLSFHSSITAGELFTALGYKLKRGSLLVGDKETIDGLELWPLITASLRPAKKHYTNP